MKIKKAIITAAHPQQRELPLQTLVDRDAAQKSALQIIIEEAVSAGAEDICIVVCPGDQDTYRRAARGHASRLHFVEQTTPLGYGHALYAAHDFVAGEPFLHLISDHLYISHTAKRCAQQLVEVAVREQCATSAVQATRESMLPYYGTLGGRRVPKQAGLYEAETVIEKPTPTEAEQKLFVPGLRSGHYLCFMGLHVLTPVVMDILGKLVKEDVARHDAPGESRRNIQLATALAILAKQERYLAYELEGDRYDIGVQYGLLKAQLAHALVGKDREEVLAQLVELLASRQRLDTKR
jgi:UTP--glucose-1-phosphate uridylyltransferase